MFRLLIVVIPFALLMVLLLAGALLAHRRMVRLRDEIGAAESRLARRFYLMQGRLAELDSTVQRLEFERRRAAGQIRFTPQMPLAEAFAVHPRVREVFAAFGLSGGGCSGPGVAESRSIAEACSELSLDPRSVLEALDRFVQDPEGPIEARAATAKLYRIHTLPPSSPN